MGDEWLNNLLVIEVEKDSASKINLNTAMFGNIKARRYPVM